MDDPVPPRLACASGWRAIYEHEVRHAHDPDGHDFQGGTSYEIFLTVTDSTGLSSSTSVTVVPDKVSLSFGTAPTGLTVEVDGISRQAPFVIDDVKGFQHTINAPAQSSAGTSYTFQSWSDGGAQSHGITVPTANQSYVATFQSAAGPTRVGCGLLVRRRTRDDGRGRFR